MSSNSNGSEGDDSGPGAREVAYRLFAAEFDDADLDYSESDEERAPNYVVTPTGLRVNRLFAVGVLTEVERVNDETLRGRVVDPTGAFVTYAGQYQPDEMAFLDRTEPPAFVALTGKARTFQPEDSERVYTSVRPESLAAVDAGTRDRWTVSAARATLRRLAVFAAALGMDERGDDLRARLEAAGVPTALASGIPLALDHYGTTEHYLEAVRSVAVDALEVVAGEVDEVRPLDADPDETGPDALGALPPVDYDLDAPAAAGADAGAEGATMADVDPEASAPDPTDEGATADSGVGERTTEADPVTADGGDGTDPTGAGAGAADEGEDGTEDEGDLGGRTDAVPDADVTGPDPDGRAEVDAAEEAEVKAEEAGADPGATSEPGAASADADADVGDFEEADGDVGADRDEGGLGDFEGSDPTPDEVESTPRGETDAAEPGDFDEPEPGEGSPNDFSDVGPNEFDDDADPGHLEEANAREFDAPDADPEAEAEVDPADPDPDDFDDALSDEERRAAEEEHGVEFSSGTNVPEPGDAGIETPDPEAGMSEGMDEEIENQHQPEPNPGAGATQPTTEDAAGTKPVGEEAAPTEGEGAEPAAVEDPADAATVDEPADADTGMEDPAEEATMEGDVADVDLDEAVVELMGELDDGDGADRDAVVAAAVDRYGADEADVEEAIQDALMGGQCYEPDEGVLKPI